MKRFFKNITVFAIALLMVFSSTMTALAINITNAEEKVGVVSVGSAREYIAPVTPSSGNKFEHTSMSNALVCSTSWKTIATSTKGFNCNVFIACMNAGTIGLGIAPSDVRMLGRNGNVLWSESGAVRGQGQRVFKCGSDVFSIQIRTQAGSGSAWAYQTNHAPTDK